MKSRIFDTGGYVYIDAPHVKGWHHCEDREFWANQRPYNKEMDSEMLKWTGSPVPKDLFGKVAALANCFPRMEIMVCLYYNIETGEWLANVPKQSGSGAHVEYNDEDYTPPTGYSFMGTIHTHPEMQAFWSGIDKKDQCSKNGLHFVLGLKSGKIDQVLCSVFYNGKQYDQKACFELPDVLPEVDPDWKARVEEKLPVEVKPYQSLWTPGEHGRLDDVLDYWWPEETYTPSGINQECTAEDLHDAVARLSVDDKYSLVMHILELLGEPSLADQVSAAWMDTFPDVNSDSCYEN